MLLTHGVNNTLSVLIQYLKLEKEMGSYGEKLRHGIHIPPFKNHNQKLFAMCFLYIKENLKMPTNRKGGKLFKMWLQKVATFPTLWARKSMFIIQKSTNAL